jgi:carbonic anhydrase
MVAVHTRLLLNSSSTPCPKFFLKSSLFTDEIIRGLLRSSLETATVDENGWRDVGSGPGSDAGDFINWHTFTDAAAAVVTDVRRIRQHPLVPASIPIYGYVYDVKTGRLDEVTAATKIGAAAD